MKIRRICLLHVRDELVYVRVNDPPHSGWPGLACTPQVCFSALADGDRQKYVGALINAVVIRLPEAGKPSRGG